MDAEHRVHRLLAWQTFVLVLITLWSVAMGLVHGFLLLALLPATSTALSGWLTAAWRKKRPWAWWVPTILFGMRFAGNGLALLTGDVSWLSAALLVFDGFLLTFLWHPDCRARIDPPVPTAVGGTRAATIWRGPGA